MAISHDHPLRGAHWIWPGGYLYLYNTYARFRHDFELAAVPPEAPFFITADAAYKLYLNGRYVCRGPARGYQSHWPFDEVDLAGHLRAGHNWITVLAYNPGISTYRYLHHAAAGLLCAGRWGDFEVASGAHWRGERIEGIAERTAHYSLQTDFQEHFDAARSDPAWIRSAEPPAGVPEGLRSPHPLSSCDVRAFGMTPYDTVEERGIPMLRETTVVPAGAVLSAGGHCGDGYGTWQNVSWGWVSEAKDAEWTPAPEGELLVAGDAAELQLKPTGAGCWRAVTLEMPEYVVGNVIVEVDGARGGEILDFQHDERLSDGRPRLYEPGQACAIAMANRLRPAAGATRHEFFHYMGFRYLTLIARDVQAPVTVRLSVRRIGYPFAMRGRFECSDPVLNEIHAACRRTQQVCSLDAYVDTPWREQAQWWGDARVQAFNTFYLDGDARLLRRGIRSIAGQQGPHGLTYGHAPTSAHNCVLPDFSEIWILTIWDYYRQTGDAALFVEQWPRVQQVLGYFDEPEVRGPDGLIRYDPRYWYFGDWADLYKAGVPTLLNLWYLLAVRRTVSLLQAAGMAAEALHWAGRAERVTKAVLSRLFDPEQQLMRDGLDDAGDPVARCSVHEQTAALMLDLVPGAEETLLRERLLPYLADEEMDAARPSAFWCTYVLDQAGARGHGEAAIRFIRSHWEPMLATGTTWEGFTDDSGTVSHAWSAHPSYHLVNILVGVRQADVAWQRVRFEPCFAEGIGWAEALVPSPAGDVRASWTREGQVVDARLALPEGVSADVVLPGCDGQVGAGEHEFQVRLG